MLIAFGIFLLTAGILLFVAATKIFTGSIYDSENNKGRAEDSDFLWLKVLMYSLCVALTLGAMAAFGVFDNSGQ